MGLLNIHSKMGIDLRKQGRIKNSNKKDSRSKNLYVHLLIRLFRFLTRRTDSDFTRTILRRLIASRVNRPPLSVSRIVKHLKGADKTVVTVATMTDDMRLLEVPKLRIAALRFTETARARIVAAGGQCLTLDQLVMTTPTGTNTLLLRGPKDRESLKYFGRGPGTPGSHTKPKNLTKSKKNKGVQI